VESVSVDSNIAEPIGSNGKEHQMTPEANQPKWPIFGFVAGTPLRTPAGDKPVEELRPGDLIQVEACEEKHVVHDVFVTHKPILVLHQSGQVIVNPGEQAPSDQPLLNFSIPGFVAGTPLLSADAAIPIEELWPDDHTEDDDTDWDCPHHDPRWWERN
jgi:hypothetical protein